MDNAKDNIVTLYVQFDDPPALHSNQDVLGGHLLGVSFCDTREAETWTPVSQGSPHMHQSLLMFTSNEELLPGHFNNQGLYISEISGRPVDDEGAEVTHWMYAPEPPDMDDVEELPCC